MPDAATSATTALSALPLGLAQPVEVFTARFTTQLTANIPSGLRPANIAVASTIAAYGVGTFSIAIYDAGTDADPQNFEALEVISGGSTLSWTVVTEAGWAANAHAAGSTVIATVLTPRSLQQPLNNHTNPSAIPDPHSIYIRKGVVTGKGNLIVGTGSGTITNLPAGADGTIPVADSTQTAGIRWVVSAIGGVLTHMGDLLVGGVLGLSTRLGIGAPGQVLMATAQTPTIASPVSAPICSATGSGGALTNGILYDFAYAWQNGTLPEGGITLPSPIATFTATTTGIVSVQCPAAPATGLTLLVYAGLHLAPLQLQGSLSTPSTISSNTIAVSAINSGVAPNTINETGGLSAQWQDIPVSASTSVRLGATASMNIGVAPTSLANPMTTVGDLITGGTSGAPTRLPSGATGTVLTSTGVSAAPSWQAATGGQVNTSVRLGATASMNIGAAQTILTNPMTAAGDLITGGSGGAAARLAPGAAGTFLQSNGAGQALAWNTASGGSGGGGSGALVPIQVIGPLTVAQATMSFSSIPQTGFKNLVIMLDARGDTSATSVRVGVQLNNDAGNNYDWMHNTVVAGTVGGTQNQANAEADVLAIAAATAPAGVSGSGEIVIRDYNATTFNKTIEGHGVYKTSASAAGQINSLCAGFWRSSAAVNAVTLRTSAGNFDVGSYACLYGEMDTAGVLLTPASNLLYDSGPIPIAQASINTGTLSQSYRDLRIVIEARGDTAATQTALQMQVNGDTGNNYSSNLLQMSNSLGQLAETISGAQWSVGDIAAATAVSGDTGITTVIIPDYTGTVFSKSFSSTGGARLANSTTNVRAMAAYGVWGNVAAVTSLLLKPAAGNFVAGTVIRVYGEPVSAGGSSVGTGTRLRLAINRAIPTSAPTVIGWSLNDTDADNQHLLAPLPGQLSGTVSTTAGSATLTGTNTSFTTQVAIGQVLQVPTGGSAIGAASLSARAGRSLTWTGPDGSGTGFDSTLLAVAGMQAVTPQVLPSQKVVVISIASDTSLTVAVPFSFTANGVVATSINSAIVFRQPGFYDVSLGTYWASASSGIVSTQVMLNGSTIIRELDDDLSIATQLGQSLSFSRQFQQWDYIEAVVIQSSGAVLNLIADERTAFAVTGRPTVIVAVPYVNIQDQKPAGTNGGTFTSGADQTRVLNTVVNDSAGISSLSSNQITLPPGTYRCVIRAPAFSVDHNVAWLFNVTDSVTILQGQNNYAGAASSGFSMALVEGRFTLSGTKTLAVRHRCGTSASTNGFGFNLNSIFIVPFEVYTVVELWKEG